MRVKIVRPRKEFSSFAESIHQVDWWKHRSMPVGSEVGNTRNMCVVRLAYTELYRGSLSRRPTFRGSIFCAFSWLLRRWSNWERTTARVRKRSQRLVLSAALCSVSWRLLGRSAQNYENVLKKNESMLTRGERRISDCRCSWTKLIFSSFLPRNDWMISPVNCFLARQVFIQHLTPFVGGHFSAKLSLTSNIRLLLRLTKVRCLVLFLV